jgi:SAM-dependent methyltransferase
VTSVSAPRARGKCGVRTGTTGLECARDAGLDVLHLQCHIDFDAISLARRGARVVGVDFSPGSLERARALARRCELAVEFVEADATSLPAELHNRFDLVYATIGVICWIDDLRAWMRSAAAALAAGLRIQHLDEHMESDFDPRGNILAREEDGRYRLRMDGERLPVTFTLVAAKP